MGIQSKKCSVKLKNYYPKLYNQCGALVSFKQAFNDIVENYVWVIPNYSMHVMNEP